MSDLKTFLSALALAGAALAPAQGSTPDPLPAQLKHCASVTVASERLACYDALAGSPALNTVAPPTPAGPSAATAGIAASGAPAATVTVGTSAWSAPAVPATAGASASSAPPAPATAGASASGAPPATSEMEFGVHNGPLAAKLISPQRQKHLRAVVSGVSNRPRGELVVTLDNGQVWVQNEPANYPLKPGDHVEIDVGALGSYVLWCPSIRRATKVTRIS